MSIFKKLIAVLAMASLLSAPAKSQDQNNPTLDIRDGGIVIDGAIGLPVVKQFIALLESQSVIERVVLNSPGGSISAGLAIARAVKAADLDTHVPIGSECHSSCSIIFLAGRERIADGLLGVHQISGVDDPSLTQSVIGQIYEELVRFNTPSHVISRMLRTPPSDIYVFTPEELERYSINIRDYEAQAEGIPHLLAVETWTRGDWVVGVFMNTHINRPFIALESREMDPLMRIVHYPHRLQTFVEFMMAEDSLTGTFTEIELRFGHGADEPFSLTVPADIEPNSYAFDLPSDPQQARLFWHAFAAGTDLTVFNSYGAEIGRYSLAGSRRAFEDYMAAANR